MNPYDRSYGDLISRNAVLASLLKTFVFHGQVRRNSIFLGKQVL